MVEKAEHDSADRIEAAFLTSAATLAQAPRDDVPEVAVAGRSNAGKSSVLNRLTGNRQLARTSKTPGRTQLINFFSTHLGGRLVDLPGYGFAKASKDKRRLWQQHVEDYLSRRDNLVALLLVMDVRRPFQPFDTQLIEWARQSELPLRALLNKSDKLKHGARVNALRDAERRLPEDRATAQLFSATTGLGVTELIAWLESYL